MMVKEHRLSQDREIDWLAQLLGTPAQYSLFDWIDELSTGLSSVVPFALGPEIPTTG